MKIIYIVFFSITTTFAVAQNSMTLISGKKVTATPEWKFICNSYSFDGFLTIQIGKTEKGGQLKLSIKTSSQQLFIGDRIFILLKNGDLIYCIDKNQRQYLDEATATFYNLNDVEFKKLTTQNITDIRFKIIGKQSTFDSQIGFFTASNVPSIFDLYSKEVVSIDTKSEIKKLLQ